MWPPDITPIRSDMVSASSWSWVTKTKVMPVSSCSRFSSLCISLRSLRSSAESGSSSSKNLRLRGKRPGERHALLLAARKLRRLALRHCFELHQRQHLGRARGNLALWAAEHFEAEADIVGDAQMRKERVALKDRVHLSLVRRQVCDVLTVEQDRARGRAVEPGDQPQKRGLAAARRAEKGEELALPDRDGNGIERPDRLRALAEYLDSIAGFYGIGLGHSAVPPQMGVRI